MQYDRAYKRIFKYSAESKDSNFYGFLVYLYSYYINIGLVLITLIEVFLENTVKPNE